MILEVRPQECVFLGVVDDDEAGTVQPAGARCGKERQGLVAEETVAAGTEFHPTFFAACITDADGPRGYSTENDEIDIGVLTLCPLFSFVLDYLVELTA